MDAHPRQDGVHQLTLRQGEVGIMIGGQDVAEQQSHPYLSQGGHVVENIPLFISTYKDIQNILVTIHIHFFFWKEYLHAGSRYCAKITYVHILTILLP